MIENRKQIEKHLSEFYKTESIPHSEMKSSKKPIDYYLDVSILYRWVFQVGNLLHNAIQFNSIILHIIYDKNKYI